MGTTIQSLFRKYMEDYSIYLDYIGLLQNENEEIFGFSAPDYESSSDNNLVNALKTLSKINSKIMDENNQLGDIQGAFESRRFRSFYVAAIDNFYLLIVFKKDFANLSFLQNLLIEFKKKLKTNQNYKQQN